MRSRILLSFIVAAFASLVFFSCYDNTQGNTVAKEKYDSLLNIIKKHPGMTANVYSDHIKPGAWILNYYVNEFGELTVNPYIFTLAEGSMTTLGTSASDLTVKIVIDKTSVRIQMYGQDDKLIRSEGTIQFKITVEATGREYVFETFNDDKGNNTLYPKYYTMFVNMVYDNTGKLMFSGTSSKQGVYRQYMFVLEDTKEFKTGMKKLLEGVP